MVACVFLVGKERIVAEVCVIVFWSSLDLKKKLLGLGRKTD